jgi:hypothetical protein
VEFDLGRLAQENPLQNRTFKMTLRQRIAIEAALSADPTPVGHLPRYKEISYRIASFVSRALCVHKWQRESELPVCRWDGHRFQKLHYRDWCTKCGASRKVPLK